MNTIRVYDTPTAAMILAVSMALGGLVAGLLADGIVYFPPMQYTGLVIAEVMAIGLAAYTTHLWVFGSKIRLSSSR